MLYVVRKYQYPLDCWTVQSCLHTPYSVPECKLLFLSCDENVLHVYDVEEITCMYGIHCTKSDLPVCPRTVKPVDMRELHKKIEPSSDDMAARNFPFWSLLQDGVLVVLGELWNTSACAC